MQPPAQPDRLSFFKPMGYQKNSCGYCKKKAGSASYYATSTRVRPVHYQELVDRGWRRSGTVYYKQDLTRSCCPHYTMRLDAKAFNAKKEQRQALNRWNRFVLGQEYIRKAAILCPQTRTEKKTQRDIFDLKTSVHKSEYSNLKRPINPKTKKQIEPAHKFEVTVEPDNFTEEKWDLFIRYQTTIHKEPLSRWKRSNFRHFLCSGMSRTVSGAGGKYRKLGSYHQCHRLDGKLVAMAVLDLMPGGVSSVYLIYDPDFGQWEFGKLSALREIALTIEGGYEYYYMGYYIHSCVKMRYKGFYMPQYLLDPESLNWDLFDDDYRKKLDANKYVSLSRDRKLNSDHDGNGEEGPNPLAIHDEVESQQPATNGSSATSGSENSLVEKEEGEASDGDDWEDPGCSLFDLNMPGVMTKEEVETEIDLDHWLLSDGDLFVEMEDLVGWETSDITQPQTLKGMVGELAAVLGPKVVKESAVKLF